MDDFTTALVIIGDQQLTIRRLEYQLQQAVEKLEKLEAQKPEAKVPD